MHFKELFGLDGKQTNFSEEDQSRRNTIVKLLNDWGLVKVVSEDRRNQECRSRLKLSHLKKKATVYLRQNITSAKRNKKHKYYRFET